MAVLPSCASSIFIASVVLSCEALIAAGSRFSGGVRIRPQKAWKIAGPTTDNCQSIHWLACALLESFGSSTPDLSCLPAR